MLDDVKQWAYDYAKTNHSGFNSYQDAEEYLDWFFDMFENLPEPLTLFRILKIEKDGIDTKNLGQHYTDKIENFTHSFLENIGFSIWEYENSKFKIVEVQVKKKNLDLYQTISNRLNYPYEDEFTLNIKYKPKVIDIHNF